MSTFSEQALTPASDFHNTAHTPTLTTPGATPGTGYQFPSTPIALSQASNTPVNSESTRWGTPKGSENKHGETPTLGRSIRKSRWDLTPSTERGTPKIQATPETYQSTPGLSTPGQFTTLFRKICVCFVHLHILQLTILTIHLPI